MRTHKTSLLWFPDCVDYVGRPNYLINNTTYAYTSTSAPVEAANTLTGKTYAV